MLKPVLVAIEVHWIQLISLDDGVQLTAADNTTYRVKALEISETFNSTDISNCSNAGINFITGPDDLSITPDDLPSVTTPDVAIPTSMGRCAG